MGYQKKNSRMFDVRPGEEGGDSLANPKIQNEPILNLLSPAEKLWRESVLNSEKTVNLRERQPLRFSYKEVPAKKRRGRPKKIIGARDEKLLEAAPPIQNFISGQPAILEGLEISLPSREEILDILEEIEEINQYLQAYGLGKIETEVQKQEIVQKQETKEEMGEIPQNLLEQDEIEAGEFSSLPSLQPKKITIWEEPEIPVWAPELTEKNNLILELEIEESLPVLADWEIEEEPKIKSRRLAPLKNNFLTGLKKITTFFSRLRLVPQARSNYLKEWYNLLKRWAPRGAGFASAGFLIWLVIFGLSIAGQGLSARDNILSSALQAYQAMLAAKDSASRFDFSGASVNLENAYQNFFQAEQELNKMGRILVSLLEKLPGGGVISSGEALIRAGENLAQAGQAFARIANLFILQKLSDSFVTGQDSLTEKILQAKKDMKIGLASLAAAQGNLSQVNIADLPGDMGQPLSSLKEKLPPISAALNQLEQWSDVFLEILGHQKAEKYLLVFQNNSEARPTGGFIGTYGVVDIDEGRIKNLFIDSIFNLDGQLYERVVPPRPIQKISTAWSTHDANWFADFPTSAKKIMWFYEKAGGTTPDGVVSLTPTVVEKLLAIAGPIDLPEYNVSLNADNFSDIIQYKVEVDYDQAQNQPKKILADFAPQFLDRLWQVWPEKSQEILQVFIDMLSQKQILFYFTNDTLQKLFIEQGWAGEMLSTDKDYLSVVNTNINGYKTDRVVEQKIYHQSQIQPDGSIIDTVKIVRMHQGGQSQYDWYNKVNADYLRVYVPWGSRLLSAQGQTLEAYSAPVDYQEMGFSQDSDVGAQEQNTTVDANSGTQIFAESGKTVFGNWVYVSPGETVEVVYQYLLPFRLNLEADNFSYSFLAQKQSGSVGSDFESTLQLPQEFKISWQYPENLEISGSQIKFSGDLKTDKFYGVVFGE